MVGLTPSMARELGPHGITVNAVCPGDVDTDMHAQVSQTLSTLKGISTEEFFEQAMQRCPLGRLGTPRDVADAVEAVEALVSRKTQWFARRSQKFCQFSKQSTCWRRTASVLIPDVYLNATTWQVRRSR